MHVKDVLDEHYQADQHDKDNRRTPKRRIISRSMDQAAQFKAFLGWLPQELHDAPGINWKNIPIGVMIYLVQTVRDDPYATYIAVATGAACQYMKGSHHILHTISYLHRFICALRSACQIENLAELRHEQIWNVFAARTTPSIPRLAQLHAYAITSERNLPGYFKGLEGADRLHMQHYALPPMPRGFLQEHGKQQAFIDAGKRNRKAQSDILVPLYPVLRQLIRFRKQLAERTFKAIREAQLHVQDGAISLPYTFEYIDTLPSINRNAKTIAGVRMEGREVTMHFTLWDKHSWMMSHQDQYPRRTVKTAQARSQTYHPDKERMFVQYTGDPNNFLWFGDLIENNLLRHIRPVNTVTDNQN